MHQYILVYSVSLIGLTDLLTQQIMRNRFINIWRHVSEIYFAGYDHGMVQILM